MQQQTTISTWSSQNKQRNVVTVFFIHDEEPDGSLLSALDTMHACEHWKLVRLRIDKDIATAFRVVKIPCLVVYSHDSEETARAVGTLNIQELITKVVL